MAKNKRRRDPTLKGVIRHIPPPVCVGFLVVVSLALVYLWIGHKCTQYSEEIKRLEDQCVELNNEKVQEETKWNAMKTADRLDELLVRHGLQMVLANAGQIVRVGSGANGLLPVAQVSPAALRGGTQVAGRGGL